MGSPFAMGEKGGEIVTGDNNMVGVGPYRGLQVIAEVTCDVMTINGVTNATALAAPTTIPVGVYLFGQGITAYSQTVGLAYLIR